MLHRASVRRFFGILALVALVGSVLAGVFAATAQAAPPPLELNVRAAILLDYETGQVLYAKDADAAIPPASLTKLMTLHLAYKKIKEGALKREDKVQVRREAWAATMPGSSVMFLEPGQDVTVGEIMMGIAVPSGNDASVAIAQHIAGTVDAFVAMMNKEARDMGYTVTQYADPAGLSPRNTVTAREFADFARRYMQMHPEALAELHSVQEFTYPLPKNKPENTQTVTQYNRNRLLWSFEGTDGLKTGFIEESGYNIALTAKRGDMRLVAVILGAPGKNDVEGARNREQAGIALLQWGFQNFVTHKPQVEEAQPVRVWKGEANFVRLEPATTPVLTVERGQETRLTSTIHQETSVVAPIQKGAKLGELVFAADGQEVAKIDLIAAEAVEQGGFFKRIWDSIRLTVAGWFDRSK